MARVGLILIIGVTAVFADLCPEPVWTNFFDNFLPVWTNFVIIFVLKTMVLIPGDSKWRDLWQKVWQLLQWAGEWIFIYISPHQVHYDQGFWLITTITTIINTITITHQILFRFVATVDSSWLEILVWNAETVFGPDPPLSALSWVI